jgi:hypothetical protein
MGAAQATCGHGPPLAQPLAPATKAGELACCVPQRRGTTHATRAHTRTVWQGLVIWQACQLLHQLRCDALKARSLLGGDGVCCCGAPIAAIAAAAATSCSAAAAADGYAAAGGAMPPQLLRQHFSCVASARMHVGAVAQTLHGERAFTALPTCGPRVPHGCCTMDSRSSVWCAGLQSRKSQDSCTARTFWHDRLAVPDRANECLFSQSNTPAMFGAQAGGGGTYRVKSTIGVIQCLGDRHGWPAAHPVADGRPTARPRRLACHLFVRACRVTTQPCTCPRLQS